MGLPARAQRGFLVWGSSARILERRSQPWLQRWVPYGCPLGSLGGRRGWHDSRVFKALSPLSLVGGAYEKARAGTHKADWILRPGEWTREKVGLLMVPASLPSSLPCNSLSVQNGTRALDGSPPLCQRQGNPLSLLQTLNGDGPECLLTPNANKC